MYHWVSLSSLFNICSSVTSKRAIPWVCYDMQLFSISSEPLRPVLVDMVRQFKEAGADRTAWYDKCTLARDRHSCSHKFRVTLSGGLHGHTSSKSQAPYQEQGQENQQAHDPFRVCVKS